MTGYRHLFTSAALCMLLAASGLALIPEPRDSVERSEAMRLYQERASQPDDERIPPAPPANRAGGATTARDALAQVNNAARGDQQRAEAALITATRQMKPQPVWRRWLTPVLGFLVIAALAAGAVWAFWRRQTQLTRAMLSERLEQGRREAQSLKAARRNPPER